MSDSNELDVVELDPSLVELDGVVEGGEPARAAPVFDAASVDDALASWLEPAAAKDPVPREVATDQVSRTAPLALQQRAPARSSSQAEREAPAPGTADARDTDQPWAREATALAAVYPTRAALLQAHRAWIALDIDGDVARADALCAQAVQLAGDARFVAMTRRWIASAKTDAAAAIAAARAELPLAGEAPERVALLWLIAGREEPADAEATLHAIIDLAPGDLGASLSLAAAAMQRGRWLVAAEAWEALAGRTDDAAARAVFVAAAGGLRDAQLGDDAGARAAFERALEVDRASAPAHAGLQWLHLRSRAFVEHARLAKLEAELVGDLDPALGYHERAGDLLWEVARDEASAAAAYERAAAVAQALRSASPDDPAASTADVVPLGKLAALHEQAGAFAQLAAVYETLLERIADPVRRGGILLRLGTIYESRLERADAARRCYEAALAAVPALAPAAQALARLHQVHERWADAAEVLLGEVDRLANPARRAARYVAIAELLAIHDGDRSRVTALYERALALDPAQGAAVDALERIYRAEARWADIATLYERQLAETTHPMAARALRVALAALYQERLAAPDKAAAHLRVAIAGEPDHYGALGALARAFADAGKWNDHVEVLEQQVALLGNGPELVAMRFRIATVIEHRLGDPVRALAAYQRVLDVDPRHELAIEAMTALYRALTRWEDVVEHERRALDLADRPEEAALIQHRIAHVCEDHLGQPDEAIEAYEAALRHVPTYRPARVALERLLRARGRHDRLATLLEEQAAIASSTVDRARLQAQAALVRELHLEDDGSATELYESALALDGSLASALWGLLRICVRRDDWTRAAERLEAILTRASHATTRARVAIQLARIHELRLDAPDRAAQFYDAALAAEHAPATLCERVRLALAADRADGCEWLDEAARATTDPRLAAGLLHVRALRIERAGDPGAAAEGYARALQHDAGPAILEGLARTSAGPALAEVLSLRTRQLADAPTRALLHAVAGALYEESDRADAAYSDALAAMPDCLVALEGRRALAERAGAWASAATLTTSMAQAAQHPANKVALFERAAELAATQLADDATAIARYEDALAVEPGRVTTLERALDLLERGAAWERAAALIADHAPRVGDDGPRADLLARRARIAAEQLDDGAGAIADLQRALTLRPGNVELVLALARLHEALRQWADAAATYQQVADCADAGVARAALLAQARIWTDEVPDYARAQRLLEQAHALDPDDRPTAAKLAAVACQAGELARGAALYEQLAGRGTATERVAALLAFIDLQRQLGTDAGDAIVPAFDLALDDPAVIPLLEARFRVQDRLEVYTAHVESVLARVPPGTPSAIPLQVSLGKIFAKERAVPERAIPYLQAAVAAASEDPALRVALATALAGHDDGAAVAELRRAIDLDPTSMVAYLRIAEICTRLGLTIPAMLASSAAALVGDDDNLAQLPFSPPAVDWLTPGCLPVDAQFAMFVGETQVPAVRRIVAQLDPHLHLVFPEHPEMLAACAPVPETYPLVAVIRAIAAAVSTPIAVYWRESTQPRLIASEPRAFVLAPEHIEDPGGRIRFDAAYTLARLASGSLLGCATSLDQVRALLLAVVDRNAEDRSDLRRRVTQALPRRARKELERVVDEIQPFNAAACDAWEQEERQRALGIAVIVSGDLRAAARSLCATALGARSSEERRGRIRATPMMVDALRFAVSEACWTSCARLYRL